MGNYGSRLNGDRKEEAAAGGGDEIRCHYELLCVEQAATPDDIKKAYRKMALLHHPDKNPHRQEEATAAFAQIQKAYEVLSDPQERAWYDRNRDAILGRARQKKKAGASGNAAPTMDDLMKYFNTGVYTGFGDDPKGFFSVYRRLFEVIEEFEGDHLDEFDPTLHTSFGAKDTPVEPSLVLFYEKWLNFTSNRPFIEVEAYDTEHADNRRMRRAMEKENERRRESLRREFSEAVRSLTAFLRKRDPRWRAYQCEKQVERDRAELSRKTMAKARRQADMENFVEADWSRKDLEDLQSAAKEFFHDDVGCSDDDDDKEDGDGEGWEDSDGLDALEDEFAFAEIYCDPCKKLFRSRLQWKNHEQSKKHKQALWKLGIRPGRDNVEEEEGMDSEESCSEGDEVQVELQSETETLGSVWSQDHTSSDDSEKIALDEETDVARLLEKIRLAEGRKGKSEESSPAKPMTKKEKKKDKKATLNTSSEEHKCTVCKTTFPSRNQLFKHVQEKGHALAPSASNAGKKKKK